MRKIKYKEKDITYVTKGKGYPVLYFHGAVTDHSTSRRFVEDLSKEGFRVILIDLPGHGKSTYWDRKLTKVVDSLKELASQLGLEEYYCMGHSMGASVCSELAVSDSRVKKTILITPVISKKYVSKYYSKLILEGLKNSEFSLEQLSRKSFISATSPDHHPSKIERRVQEILRQNWQAFAAGFFWNKQVKLKENILALGDRCLVVAARHDVMAPLKYVEEITTNLKVIECNHSNPQRKHLGLGKDNIFVKFFSGAT